MVISLPDCYHVVTCFLPMPDYAVFSLDDRAGRVETVTAPDPEAASEEIQPRCLPMHC
jgi:hypothetical protein